MQAAFFAVQRLRRALGAVAACAGAAAAQAQPSMAVPEWAYPVPPPGFTRSIDDGHAVRMPGSHAAYTWTQLRDLFTAPDWHPGDYLPMPEIVRRGRAPGMGACSHCHRAGGQGGPENANIAGLPYAYIVRQLRDYQQGTRSTAVAGRAPQALMIRSARAMTGEDIETAARYFSNLQPHARIRVVEAARIPAVEAGSWILVPSARAGDEPLGQRIVELPQDLEQFEARDPRARFVAYVPPGSVARGLELAQSGGRSGLPACVGCHGGDLRGTPLGPPLAGRCSSNVPGRHDQCQRLPGIARSLRVPDQCAAIACVFRPLPAPDAASLPARPEQRRK